MTQTITTVLEHVIDSLSEDQEQAFQGQIHILDENPHRGINAFKRDDPIFTAPIDLEKLIKASYTSFFEISHYPGGIIIGKSFENRGKYRVGLTRRNMRSEPLAEEVFSELGLSRTD